MTARGSSPRSKSAPGRRPTSGKGVSFADGTAPADATGPVLPMTTARGGGERSSVNRDAFNFSSRAAAFQNEVGGGLDMITFPEAHGAIMHLHTTFTGPEADVKKLDEAISAAGGETVNFIDSVIPIALEVRSSLFTR